MNHLLATIGLAPILLAQGSYVVSTIQKLPEPPGEREGVAGEGKPLRLLVLGDSSAAGVGAPTLDESLLGRVVAGLEATYRVEYKLIARTGARTRGTLGHLNKRPEEAFDVVVVALGVNDVAAGRSVSAWSNDLGELVELLRAKFSARYIYISGMPPVSSFPALPQPLRWYLGSQAKRYDIALEAFAESQADCEHVQLDFPLERDLMASDMFHPGPRVYAQWGGDIAERIVEAGR
ncbi:hypothetical protein BSKO_03696 [Bryopsis sp. KO-2023]|nr:hypothetical protein BSKO_03696 [Bryopsis sp. KO-2023]